MSEDRKEEPQIVSRDEARARCLKRFFDGLPCPAGHVTEHFVSNGRCLQCAREALAMGRLKKSASRKSRKMPGSAAAAPVATPQRPEERAPAPQEVRPVQFAEIDALLEWGLALIRRQYPRARYETVRPILALATRGGHPGAPMRFVRTDTGFALFDAVRDGFEPEFDARVRIAVDRDDDNATALVSWGRAWAATIGAVRWNGAPLE